MTESAALVTVACSGREAWVYFRDGALVYAGSNREEFRLGSILLRRKKITPEQRAEIIARYPAHEREARVKGIPVLGSGRVFPIAEERLVTVEPQKGTYVTRIRMSDVAEAAFVRDAYASYHDRYAARSAGELGDAATGHVFVRRLERLEEGPVGAADSQLAIEDEAVKKSILADLTPHLGADTLLASNTSSISITRLASTTDRPERFIGLHFMNPVPLMKLVEVVRTALGRLRDGILACPTCGGPATRVEPPSPSPLNMGLAKLVKRQPKVCGHAQKAGVMRPLTRARANRNPSRPRPRPRPRRNAAASPRGWKSASAAVSTKSSNRISKRWARPPRGSGPIALPSGG